MKKTIARLLSFVIVMSTLVCGGTANAADESVSTVNKSSVFFVLDDGRTFDDSAQVSGGRKTFMTFDFTGYEAQLYAASGVTIKAQAQWSTDLIQDIAFYAIDDALESNVKYGLTYNDAVSNSVWTGGTVVAQRTEQEDIRDLSLSMDAEALKRVLSGGNNSILALRAELISGWSHNAQINPNTISIAFTYPTDYVTALADNMQWSDISEQDIDCITQNISLPSKYNGCDVTWSSDNTGAIEADGTIHYSNAPQAVTLTATLNANGISAVKSFNVTVSTRPLSTSNVNMSNGGFICFNYGDTSFPDQMQVDRDRRSFALFDLTGHEAELYGATGIKITGSRITNDSWVHLYSFSIYVLDESKEQYITDTLTYNNGHKYLWGGGDLLAQRTDDTDTANFEIDVDKEALIKAFESGTDGIVAIRIQPIGDTTLGNTWLKTDLKLTFTYDDESEAYKNYLQTRVSNLLWSSISEQAQNRVYKDIVLPQTLDGNSIQWTSSNEDIIKSTGEVVNGKTLQPVTLSATVKEYSKAFDLMVTPEFYVDTPVVEVTEEAADVVFASYNAADTAKNYFAIIAVYEGDKLKAVQVKDVESAAGEAAVIPLTMTGVSSGCSVKAFAWNNLGQAVPLCVNAK